MDRVGNFKLSDNFIDKYKRKKPPFGFNGLGYLVYMRTYSRIKENGENERWWETVKRVVEGTYSMQKNHIDRYNLGWNPWQAQNSAQEMFDRIFNMKFLPPGRGLWAMGTAITEEKNLWAALNNCAFVSTKTIKEDLSKPFTFLMDASMLGVGVGFDVKGAGQLDIKGPNLNRQIENFIIPDTREGWVESIKLLIESYFLGAGVVKFNYDKIRDAGVQIKGFGGVSSGHEPLKEVHEDIRKTLEKNIGSPITVTTIVDIMNLIGKCVVSGNVRRTAEIVFGDSNDDEYINLKNYKLNKHREKYGWTSNNSVFATLGMDYSNVAERINDNGEPGFAWLENMREYSRIRNGKDNKDHRVAGGNPCVVGDTIIQTNTGKLTMIDIVNRVENNEKIKVLTFNENTLLLEFNIVTNAWLSRKDEVVITLKIEEDGIIYKLTCTSDHKIYTINRGYVEAKDLTEDDDIKIIT